MAYEIFVVSDFTGETAEHVAQAAASQFGSELVEFSRYRYVNTREKVLHLLDEATEKDAVVMCTLVDKELRQFLVAEADRKGLLYIDLLGPILTVLEKKLGKAPLETPGLLRKMDEDYFRRVKAIEFAIKCDDGRSPELLSEAELVIVGVSRTSKTPLSMYLAHNGVKVANVPLVPEASLPEELFQIPPERAVGLTIQPEKLIQIRQERLRVLGLDPEESNYVQWERVEEELAYARSVFNKLRCKPFNVTNRAIEETAQEILDHLRA